MTPDVNQTFDFQGYIRKVEARAILGAALNAVRAHGMKVLFKGSELNMENVEFRGTRDAGNTRREDDAKREVRRDAGSVKPRKLKFTPRDAKCSACKKGFKAKGAGPLPKRCPECKQKKA